MTELILSQDQPKKYDYLNKYNQHEILQQAYEDEAHQIKHTFPSPQKTYVQLTVDSPVTKTSIMPQFKHNLSEEVHHQNIILNEQIKQYKILVVNLEKQIESLREENAFQKENHRKDKACYEKIIHELKEDIGNTQYHHQISNQQMRDLKIMKYQNESLNQALEAYSKENDAFLRRLKDLEASIKNSLGLDQKMNIEEAVQCIKNEKRRRKVLEDFTRRIFEMYEKINRNPCNDLKILWKWLKNLGSQNNYLQKIKPILKQKMKCQETASVQELLQISLIQSYR